jgi:hypothetical protein
LVKDTFSPFATKCAAAWGLRKINNFDDCINGIKEVYRGSAVSSNFRQVRMGLAVAGTAKPREIRVFVMDKL